MSIRELFPGDRGGGAAQDAASLLAGIALPLIEPFGSDNEALAGLPDRPMFLDHGGFDAAPASRVSVARDVYDTGVQALSVLKCVQDALDGCRARLVARVAGAAAVEAAALSLDRWQSGVAVSSAATEVAMALGIPELTAAALEHHATVLVRERPDVMAALEAGVLSWRHATIIHDEISTLQETPGTTAAEAAVLEARLLVLAENTTASSFAGKARRARERMHPETITTRTKEAFTKRKIACDAGTDGMSWLSLHVPTVSASAIYTRCTRLARAVKAEAAGTGQDCDEHRTLAQLRADIATILLLGQDLPASKDTTGSSNGGGAGSNSTATGAAPGDSDSAGTRAGDGVSFGQASAFGVTLIEESPGCTPFGSTAAPSAGSRDTGATSPDPGTTSTPPNTPSGASPEAPIGASPQTTPGPSGDGSSDTPPDTSPRTFTAPGTVSRGPSAAAAAAAPGGAASGTCRPGPGGTVVPDPGAEEAPVTVGAMVGDGSGYLDGLVDGILEDPAAEYLQQLQDLAGSTIMVDPPLPEALVIVTVPFLGLLGFTDEPAELAGPQGGPVPQELARKLLGNSSSFLRVLTDPITGEALPLEPQRYTLRAAEKAVLQALAGGCYVPNCPNPVMDTDLDHLRAFEFGGTSTLANLKPACKRHHVLKHFKDDKDRHGRRRSIDEPDRHNIKLRGWSPKTTPDGRIGWITPSGAYRPPQNTDPRRPRYPKWLKNLITKATQNNRNKPT